MISKNSKNSDPQRLFLNLTDKIDLRRKDKYIPYKIMNLLDDTRNQPSIFVTRNWNKINDESKGR